MHPPDKKISAGTCIMLVVTIIVLIGTAMVMIRFFSGNFDDYSSLRPDETRTKGSSISYGTKTGSSASAGSRDRSQYSQYYTVPVDASVSTAGNAGGRFTLTVAGTTALEGDVRKSSYLSDMKIYDLSETMSLLKNELQSDINIVFLENILMDNVNPSDIIAPSATAEMLKEAGFNIAACGFQGAWNKKAEGIAQTRGHLIDAGITPIGIYQPDDADSSLRIMNCGGIPTAILQYTGTITQNDRKKMKKENQSNSVPAADIDLISADIAKVRSQGADLVIVLMNWGGRNKAPDSKQKQLAQQIADAGADIIIGSGSRTPQKAEYLAAVRSDGSEVQVPCVWSLGITLTKERNTAKQMAGYLFHAEFIMDSTRNISISDLSYTPLYTWMYTLDKRNFYRVVAANRTVPEGMEIKQQNTMSHVADITREALKDSPLVER